MARPEPDTFEERCRSRLTFEEFHKAFVDLDKDNTVFRLKHHYNLEQNEIEACINEALGNVAPYLDTIQGNLAHYFRVTLARTICEYCSKKKVVGEVQEQAWQQNQLDKINNLGKARAKEYVEKMMAEAALTPDEILIVQEYFWDELTLKELSESRGTDHNQAYRNLRKIYDKLCEAAKKLGRRSHILWLLLSPILTTPPGVIGFAGVSDIEKEMADAIAIHFIEELKKSIEIYSSSVNRFRNIDEYKYIGSYKKIIPLKELVDML